MNNLKCITCQNIKRKYFKKDVFEIIHKFLIYSSFLNDYFRKRPWKNTSNGNIGELGISNCSRLLLLPGESII